ncbi:MAG: biopolymer transporter ExbD [Verrucomicrobiota bacterium]
MRKKGPEPEEFQMAPMIDMVFLLLVFFMTVSTLAQAQKRVPLDLPESLEAEVPDDLSNRTPISVKADGTVYWGATETELEVVTERLESLLSDEPELQIQLRADRTTPFSEVKKVLEACAEAGAYEVIYSTYESGS